MKKTYTLEQIESELEASSNDVLEHESQIAKMYDTCREYGLKPHPLWLSDTGRFTMAAIVAAKISGDTKKVQELRQQWEAWAGPPPGT